MSALKGTPGPWVVCPTNSGTFVKSEQVAGYLAEVRHCRTAQDVKADARLIAAAPDLLEALEIAREIASWNAEPDDLAMIDAAIAKATGEQA